MSAEAASPTIEAPAANIPQPFQEAFSDLESVASSPEELGGSPEAEQKPKPEDEEPQKTVAEVEDAGKAEAEAKAKEAAEAEAKAKSEAEAKAKQKPQSRAAELRQAYENLKAKTRQLESDLAASRAETQTLKSKPAEDPEKKSLQEKITDMQKRLDDAEARMRFTDYEHSEEYKEKYYQPFVDAYQAGRQKAASLKFTDAEGNVRQGTAEDFDRIVQANDDDAADLANQLFGNKASAVLYHRERVQELNSARSRAIEQFKKTGSEQAKQRQEQMAAQAKKMGEMFHSMVNKSSEKFPQLFKPIEGDAKGNEILQKGFDLVDAIFVRGGRDAQGNPIPPEKLVAMHASIRNRAAAFGRMVHLNNQLKSKIAALEKDLKEFQGSEPGSDDGKGRAAPSSDTPEATWAAVDASMEKLAVSPT